MSDQSNHFPGDKLDVPRSKVQGRAVGHQLRTDGGELRTCAIAPSQQKLFCTSISRTVALDANELEGYSRDREPAKGHGGKGKPEDKTLQSRLNMLFEIISDPSCIILVGFASLRVAGKTLRTAKFRLLTDNTEENNIFLSKFL